MGIKVNIYNISRIAGQESREENKAKVLKESLEKEFSNRPNVEGTFHILTNVTFGGGQVSEADIVLLCDLKNIDFELTSPLNGEKLNVIVQKLCYIIELKNHNSFNLKGNQFIVEYNGVPHDVSAQSRQQKFDFSNYLNNIKGIEESPYIYNFIWFTSVSSSAIESQINKLKDSNISFDDNSLASRFTFKKLLQKTIATTAKSIWVDHNNICWMNGFHNNKSDLIDRIIMHFTDRKVVVGDLTQKKLNIIAFKTAKQDMKGLEKDMFTQFKGRAGTGKTIKLLQRAVQLKNEGNGNRCLLLTYNQALVNDIKRLLYYAGETQKPGEKSVQVSTLHSFFLDLLVTLDVRKNKVIDINSYFNDGGNYEKDLKELLNIKIPSYTGSDFKYLKELEPKIDWDYIFIDEAQDWMSVEKDILFKIYGPERIIVADGIDQFMRSGNKLYWEDGIEKKNVLKDSLSLRQKNNLVSFVNSIADRLDVDWEVNPNDSFTGGEVYITDGYSRDLHEALLSRGRIFKAEPYDLLFLVPRQSVKKDHFILYDVFQEDGIHIFDGTNPYNRNRFPIIAEDSRLYQYDSCRGLEGWTVVCYKFDLIFNNKKDDYLKKIHNGQIVLPEGVTEDEYTNDLAALWILMPLTRAIDTLVITLDNPNSYIGTILKKLSSQKGLKDYVYWTIK